MCGRTSASVTVLLSQKRWMMEDCGCVRSFWILLIKSGLSADQWASGHGRAHGGGRVFLTLRKYCKSDPWAAQGDLSHDVTPVYCLCRMKRHIKRFQSPIMWKRVVRKPILLSSNCSKSSARALLARWADLMHQSVNLWVFVSKSLLSSQVFLVRKILGPDAGQLYAMKVLKKASLKGKSSDSFLTLQIRQTKLCSIQEFTVVHLFTL